MMANLLDRKWRATERFLAQQASSATRVAFTPTRARVTCEPHGQPPLDPGGGIRRPCETLSRGSAAGTVLGDRCWCLLTHSSSQMGL